MTRRSYWIFAAVLLMAVTAVTSAALQAAFEGNSWGIPPLLVVTAVFGFPLLAGTVVGAIFGLVLAAWSRRELPLAFASGLSGSLIGSVATVGCGMSIDGWLLAAIPAVLISAFTLWAFAARRYWHMRHR